MIATRTRRPRPDVTTLTLPTMGVASWLCAVTFFTFLCADLDPEELARVVVQVAPTPDWLDEHDRGRALVRVERGLLRAVDPPLSGEVRLADRPRAVALLELLALGDRTLVLALEDGVTTQELVWLTEDADLAGFAAVKVRIESD